MLKIENTVSEMENFFSAVTITWTHQSKECSESVQLNLYKWN